MDYTRNAHIILLRNLKGLDHFTDLSIDRKVPLKWKFKKHGERVGELSVQINSFPFLLIFINSTYTNSCCCTAHDG
jgi:hypothetical protein